MNIWSGVYKDKTEIQNLGDADNEIWLHKAIARAYELKHNPSLGYDDIVMLATLCSSFDRSITILDFGGSIGFSYLPLKALLNGTQLNYHIVETASVCNAGRLFFKEDVTFHTDIPDISIDIVYVRTAIQYVDDWKEKLLSFVQLKPDYMLFNELAVGDIPTYLSVQQYYDINVPYWFINSKEFDEVLVEGGYHLSYELPAQLVDQTNFPKEYQLKRACHKLFAIQ